MPSVSASDVVCSADIGLRGHILCREIMSLAFANDSGYFDASKTRQTPRMFGAVGGVFIAAINRIGSMFNT